MHKHREESLKNAVNDADIDIGILRNEGSNSVRDKAGAGRWQATQYNLSLSVSQFMISSRAWSSSLNIHLKRTTSFSPIGVGRNSKLRRSNNVCLRRSSS